MIHYKNLSQAELVLDALGSPVRREILDYILADPGVTLTVLANRMHLTGGALTAHVKILSAGGLIKLESAVGKRGVCKKCYAVMDKMLLDLAADYNATDRAKFEIPLGRYSECDIAPYCAIASKTAYIGERDDPRYFTYPEREAAALLYFRRGKITYPLPQVLRRNQTAKSLSVSFEISSKHAGFGRSGESEVTFYLCQKAVGTHAVDGEFFERRGYLTPEWYDDGYGQYGSLKTLSCTESGTFLDGIRLSGITPADLNLSSPSFGLSASTGVMLFGAGFGDYDTSIEYRVEYAKNK